MLRDSRSAFANSSTVYDCSAVIAMPFSEFAMKQFHLKGSLIVRLRA